MFVAVNFPRWLEERSRRSAPGLFSDVHSGSGKLGRAWNGRTAEIRDPGALRCRPGATALQHWAALCPAQSAVPAAVAGKVSGGKRWPYISSGNRLSPEHGRAGADTAGRGKWAGQEHSPHRTFWLIFIPKDLRPNRGMDLGKALVRQSRATSVSSASDPQPIPMAPRGQLAKNKEQERGLA